MTHMGTKAKRSIVILENTAVKAARDIVYGVMRYASTRPEWKAVGNLAKIVGCSTRLLEKDFKTATGRSIIDEHNRIRLAKVQELLRNTSLDETAIDTASGFGSCAYLRNLFRKRFGLTMRTWRQRRAKPASR